jgi:pimeloyl-ACP methyl ester carboxylesterase
MPQTELDGSSVRYEVLGRGAPVVLSAGGWQPLEAVRPLGEALAGKHQVILWDRANVGRSSLRLDGARDVDMWSDQLSDLLWYLGCGPAVVAGASVGGRVSCALAYRYPEAVRGLFLWLPTGGPVADILKQNYYLAFAPLAERDGMAAVAAEPWWAERLEAVPADRARFLAMDPRRFAATMRRWAAAMRADDPIVGATPDDLRKITAPTVILRSTADDLGHPTRNSDLAASCIANVELIAPPGYAEAWSAIRAAAPVATGYERISMLPGLIDRFVDGVSS